MKMCKYLQLQTTHIALILLIINKTRVESLSLVSCWIIYKYCNVHPSHQLCNLETFQILQSGDSPLLYAHTLYLTWEVSVTSLMGVIQKQCLRKGIRKPTKPLIHPQRAPGGHLPQGGASGDPQSPAS